MFCYLTCEEYKSVVELIIICEPNHVVKFTHQDVIPILLKGLIKLKRYVAFPLSVHIQAMRRSENLPVTLRERTLRAF